jgi:hypothetical protein
LINKVIKSNKSFHSGSKMHYSISNVLTLSSYIFLLNVCKIK